MSERICSVDGCPKKAKTRGWCSMHYERVRLHGELGPAHHLNLPNLSPCAVDGCDQRVWSRGWCGAHYARWQRYGDPTHIPSPPPPREWTVAELLANADRHGDCRLWQGQQNDQGYGYARHAGRLMPVHRLMHELAIAPIPDGWDIDHLCRQTTCIAPWHIEAVTRSENQRRAWAVALECRRLGHESPVGHRACRPCFAKKRSGLNRAACPLFRQESLTIVDVGSDRCQASWLEV